MTHAHSVIVVGAGFSGIGMAIRMAKTTRVP
jgi:cation diffusion facilitator CzcD-associated flavoprotein CzcO